LAGFDVIAFPDPIVALNAIEAGQHIDALVTRVTFPEGKPHGVSLALLLRTKYPGLGVVFAARAERIEHTEGIGELVPHPVDLTQLVEAVERAIHSDDPGSRFRAVRRGVSTRHRKKSRVTDLDR
jgi:hypothetical protein